VKSLETCERVSAAPFQPSALHIWIKASAINFLAGAGGDEMCLKITKKR
jgi:hypothetical protein